MLKRTLCMLLSVCMMVQILPLTVFAQMIDGTQQGQVSEKLVIPEAFEINGFNTQDGIATVMSPENIQSAVVAVSQTKNGVIDSVNTVTTDLIIGENTIVIPDYERDDSAIVEVMLWDSADKMRPLCNSLEIGAETY